MFKNKSNSNKVWITWHYSARSRNIAKFLDLNLYEYFNNKNLFSRHFLSSLWTIQRLIIVRPKVVFIQYSFLLLLIISLYKILNFYSIIIVVDCHTKALRRKANGVVNLIFWPIKKLSFKFADVTIISNSGMEKDISELHDKYFVLPDKIPNINVESPKNNEKYCVYISSFAVDEPFEEIFEVARILASDFKIYWTGKNKNDKLVSGLPESLVFTGYLNFEDYYNLIGNADCVLALTTEEDCLQSGAYEALGAEVPMVISDTKALKNYFEDAAVYTSHAPKEIAMSILYCIKNKEDIMIKIREVKIKREEEFLNQIHAIVDFIKTLE